MFNKYKHIKTVVKWLIIGPLKKAKYDVFLIIAYQVISTLFQVASFFILIRFIKLLLNNWNISFLQYTYNFSEDRSVIFWLVFFGVLILLIAGSSFSYFGRQKTAHLAIKTEEEALKQITQIYAASLCEDFESSKYLPDHTTLTSFFNRGGRFIGRIAMAVSSSFVPFFMMLVSMVFLFYLKPFLTISLMAILVLSLPIFGKLAFRARNISSDLLKHARQSTLDKNRYLDFLRKSVNRPGTLDSNDFHWITGTASIQGFMDAYESRLRITALSTYFTQVVIAAMLVSILLASIYPVVLGFDFPVSSTLIYIIAFKFFGSGLIAMANTFITVNVFYTYCQSMVLFLDQSKPESIEKCVIKKSMTGPELKFSLVFYPEKPLAVNFYANVDWSNIKVIVHSLSNYLKSNNISLPNNCRLLSPDFTVFDENYFRNFDMSGKDDFQILKDYLFTLRILSKSLKNELSSFQEDQYSADAWNKLSAQLKILLLATLFSKKSKTKLIFIDGVTFMNMPKNLQMELLTCLNKHYVIVVFPGKFKYKKVDNSLFDTFACITPDGLTWVGDFSEARKKNIDIDLFVPKDQKIDELLDDYEEI